LYESGSPHSGDIAQAIEKVVKNSYTLQGQVVLGGESFLERLKGKWKGSKREQPSVRAFEVIGPDAILSVVSRCLGVAAKEITRKRSGRRDQRGMAIELMYRYSGLSQAEIGNKFGGLDYSAVSRERKRLREKLTADRKLSRVMEKLNDELMIKVKI